MSSNKGVFRLSSEGSSAYFMKLSKSSIDSKIQARIAHLVAHRLGTGEVPGSNPGKGENFSMKIIK